MKAVVLRAPGDVGVDDVPDPSILDPGDAIVAVSATAICGADLFPFHGMTPWLRGRNRARTRVCGRGGRDRGGRAEGAARAARREHEHDLGRHLPGLPGRAGYSVHRTVALRLLGRLPAPGRRSGRARPGAAGRPFALAPPRRGERRGGRLPRGHPSDGLRRGRPRRRAGGRHGSGRRLWARRADGSAVRGRDRGQAARGRRRAGAAGACRIARRRGGRARPAPPRSSRRRPAERERTS